MSGRRRNWDGWKPEPQPTRAWQEEAAECLRSTGAAVEIQPDLVTATLPSGSVFTVGRGWVFTHYAPTGGMVLEQKFSGIAGIHKIVASYARTRPLESGDGWPGLA